MDTASVKISATLLRKIKKHIKTTKQTIGGFISIAVEKELQKEIDVKAPDLIKEHNRNV